ncbi:MAG: DNA recombination protein RmuC [Pseudomonadota bacterium]
MQGSPLLTEDAPAVVAGSVEQSSALITGKALYLWTGASAVLFIMVMLFILLGRWRAGRKKQDAARSADFFQPAGEDAEITFDDTAPVLEGAPSSDEIFFQNAEPEPKKKKTSPFSSLFARREKSARTDPQATAELLDLSDEPSDLAVVAIDRTPISAHAAGQDTSPVADWDAIESQTRRREEEAEARWRAMEDDRQERLAEEVRRRAERESAARFSAAGETYKMAPDTHASHSAHDDVVRTLSEVEEALQVQREAIQAETRGLLESFARRFSDRLDALAQSVDQRAAQRFADPREAALTSDGSALVDITRRLDDHRSEVAGALNALNRRLDQMPAAAAETAAIRNELAELRSALNGAATPSAPNVQLGEIVKNALSPGGYEFDALLANNRRADCLIRLARPPGPIAIDARFPVEAFHALHERKSASAENEFRRVALRHIVDVAERLISPGFTADSALLFLPSESMASEIHARFPDIVQDSYRARVWIVSPTSLMATLHTMTALLRDTPKRGLPSGAETAARQALTEVERLAARISLLEKGAAAQRPDPRDLLSANDQSEWRPDAPAPFDYSAAPEGEKAGDLFADDTPSDTRHQTQARPPFPLR